MRHRSGLSVEFLQRVTLIIDCPISASAAPVVFARLFGSVVTVVAVFSVALITNMFETSGVWLSSVLAHRH
jgi:hypothetical protein